jgi:hypothetical protein
MDATMTMLKHVGVPVDFFLYQDGATIKAEGSFGTEFVDAMACLPKNYEFDIMK